MNDLFIKTMKKLQENRRTERNSKILKEDKTVDLEGEEKDVVTVIDPDLSEKEFKEKQKDVEEIIDNTPEGEQVVDTEYVGMNIYTCPLCLTNFYSEVEMQDEDQCPVCYEIPEKFVFLGKVEQAPTESEEEMLDQAEQNLDNPEQEKIPEDESNGDEEIIDNPEDKDEENKLFDSKEVNIDKDKVIDESLLSEKVGYVIRAFLGETEGYISGNPEEYKIVPNKENANFYNDDSEAQNHISDIKNFFNHKVKLIIQNANINEAKTLTEGGIYPVQLDTDTSDALENKLEEIFGGDVQIGVSDLELIPAKGFGGAGVYWYRANINISDENLINKYINKEDTPEAFRLKENNDLVINMYSDIDISDDNYSCGLTLDSTADDTNMEELDKEADLIGDKIINVLKEHQNELVEFLKNYEILDDEEDFEDEGIDESKEIKTEDTITVPVEVEAPTKEVPQEQEVNVDDILNKLNSSESINELGNVIIVIPDGNIKDAAKGAFDGCMDEYNFDVPYVASKVVEAINEAKITDYMPETDLERAVKTNSILKNIAKDVNILDNMIIEITTDMGKSYYKAILNDNGEFELYWISKDGKQLGDSFLLSEAINDNFMNSEDKVEETCLDEEWVIKE